MGLRSKLESNLPDWMIVGQRSKRILLRGENLPHQIFKFRMKNRALLSRHVSLQCTRLIAMRIRSSLWAKNEAIH